jgi:hypothetical protein
MWRRRRGLKLWETGDRSGELRGRMCCGVWTSHDLILATTLSSSCLCAYTNWTNVVYPRAKCNAHNACSYTQRRYAQLRVVGEIINARIGRPLSRTGMCS